MEKYSVEWKQAENKKHSGWAQKHGDTWKWHCIEFNTEYSKGDYSTKKDCELENLKKGGTK